MKGAGLRAPPQTLGNPEGRGKTHRFSGRYQNTALHPETTLGSNVPKAILGTRVHRDELVNFMNYPKIGRHRKGLGNPLFQGYP